LQAGALAKYLFDPSTKMMLTYFGGVEYTGFYEVLNRLITQARSVLVSGLQLLIPYISNIFSEKNITEPAVLIYYRKIYSIVQTSIITLLPVAMIVAVYASLELIPNHHADKTLIIFGCLVGWSANMVSVPAYMFCVAFGRISWTVSNHFLIGIVNIMFGCLGGYFLGGAGVVLGMIVALVCGSVSLLYKFGDAVQYSHKNNLLTKGISIFVGNILLIILFYTNANRTVISDGYSYTLIFGITFGMSFINAWLKYGLIWLPRRLRKSNL